jgi:Mlc titration factor MtfA (ptsG expression regulator)
MNLESEENSIIREYASLNFEEFFAVCVENFFERPRALKRVFPDLFDDLKELLNQDTTQTNPWANSRKVRQITIY